MTNEQIKQNLGNMVAMSQSPTPAAALKRIIELENVLRNIEYWFDTDQEILDNMATSERDDHIRQHKMLLESLF